MLDDRLMKEVVSDYFTGFKQDFTIFNICLTADIALKLLRDFAKRKDTELGLSTMKEEDLYSLYLFYLATLDTPFSFNSMTDEYNFCMPEDFKGYSTEDIIGYVDSLVSRRDIQVAFLPDYKWTPECVRESVSVYSDFSLVSERLYNLLNARRDFSFELKILGTLLERMYILGESLKMCDLKYNTNRDELLKTFYSKYSKMDEVFESCRDIKATTELYRVQHVHTIQ